MGLGLTGNTESKGFTFTKPTATGVAGAKPWLQGGNSATGVYNTRAVQNNLNQGFDLGTAQNASRILPANQRGFNPNSNLPAATSSSAAAKSRASSAGWKPATGSGGGGGGFDMGGGSATDMKIGAATDALTEAQKTAERDLEQRAAAFGGGSGGGASQAAARQIAADFAGLRNNAERDIRVADEEAARDQAFKNAQIAESRAARQDSRERFEKELALKQQAQDAISSDSAAGRSGGGGSGFQMRTQGGVPAGVSTPPTPQSGFGPGMIPPSPLTPGAGTWIPGQGFMDPSLRGTSRDPMATFDPWAGVRGSRVLGPGAQMTSGGDPIEQARRIDKENESRKQQNKPLIPFKS